MNVKIKYILTCILIVSLSNCVNAINSLTDSAKESGFNLALLGLAGTGGSQQVDPNRGAVIQAPTMSLTVPVGALNNSETITYAEETIPEAQESTVPVQAAYKFGPAGLQFNTAATLEICYDPQVFANKGLKETTAEIQYMDPDTGQYISVGGNVNLATHCVSAPIYHFSVYLLTAQIIEPSVGTPNIGGATFYPSTLIENLPATVRTRVTPPTPLASIASVVFYYRTAGSGAPFKPLLLQPENFEASDHWYSAKIPETDIFAAGLEYYIEAHNTYNKSRLRPLTAPLVFDTVAGDIRDGSINPIKIWQSVTNMSAGYSRNLNLRVKGNSSATWFNVIADDGTSIFEDGDGVVSRVNLLQNRYTAQLRGNSRLVASYGNLTTTEAQITIHPGMLTRIDILYNNVVLPDPFEVDGLDTRDLDAAGYDAFNNFMLVLPTFSTTGGAGTVDNTVNYGKFTAANVGVDTLGTIIATLGAFTETYNVLIHPVLFPPCQFDSVVLGQGFDSSCSFGP